MIPSTLASLAKKWHNISKTKTKMAINQIGQKAQLALVQAAAGEEGRQDAMVISPEAFTKGIGSGENVDTIKAGPIDRVMTAMRKRVTAIFVVAQMARLAHAGPDLGVNSHDPNPLGSNRPNVVAISSNQDAEDGSKGLPKGVELKKQESPGKRRREAA